MKFLSEDGQFFRFVQRCEFWKNGENGVERSVHNLKILDVMAIMVRYSESTENLLSEP